MPKLQDLTGQRFAELTVEGMADFKMKGRPAWICICDCGQRKTVRGESLKTGDVKCCGLHKTAFALRALIVRSQTQNRKYPKDTDSHSRLYTLWRAMLWRCTDPLHEAYSRYGGIGIRVCDAWLEYEGFRSWAVSSGYSNVLTIDRRDNDGNYEPGNCRWATPRQQAHNRKRPLVTITAFSETKPLILWAEDHRCRVSYRTLSKRIRAGHPPEFALTATEHEARCKAQDSKRSPLPRHLR